jgi:predicted ribosome quality control (RQC) complex YloA/Tae2 family protein
MKSISFEEFDLLVEAAQPFIGSLLDSVVLDNDILILNLHRPSGPASLVIDVRSRSPFFAVTDQQIPRLKKQIKPIVLFLRAHGEGLRLKSIQRNKKYGRLIECYFEKNNRHLTLEAHLFPQGKNIIVKTEDSSICLKKPHELTEVQDTQKPLNPRSAEELYLEWKASLSESRSKTAEKSTDNGFESQLKKKRSGLEKLLENQKKLQEVEWKAFADWLNIERTEFVPKEYAHLYDVKKSVLQNIEKAFSEAKKNKSKQEALEQRIESLRQEIGKIEKNAGSGSGAPLRKAPESPLQGVKGRTREFEDNIRAYIGKSGADNLKLLRQSKPWSIWVHAKDWPSAHAIISLNKGQKLPSSVLKNVCLWVLKETISDKQWQSWLGVKVDYLYSERRFIHPIKGDHHGRVRYAEAKSITLVTEEPQ